MQTLLHHPFNNSSMGPINVSSTRPRISSIGPDETQVPSHSASRCRLALAAVLLGCPLACTRTQADPLSFLQYGTISNVSASVSFGDTIGTFSFPGATNYLYEPLTITSGSGFGVFIAENVGYGYGDVVGLLFLIPTASSIGTASAAFDMTFSDTVLFSDYPILSTDSWSVTGLGPITTGQVFNPGTYTFHLDSIPSGTNTFLFSIGLFSAVPESTASPVPWVIVGAGIVGLGWRRRRRSAGALDKDTMG